MKIKVKKINETAVIPKYSKPGDAGLDLTAVSIVSDTTSQVIYDTGLAIEIPEEHVGLIFPRSSICNYELELSNSVGVVDSGYRGTIRFVFNKTNGIDSLKYKVGDRIGQLLILPYPEIELVEVNELNDSERGHTGFGSTGK